jgi:hypothetical protein
MFYLVSPSDIYSNKLRLIEDYGSWYWGTPIYHLSIQFRRKSCNRPSRREARVSPGRTSAYFTDCQSLKNDVKYTGLLMLT